MVAYLCRIPAVHGLAPAAIEVIYCVKKTIRPGEQLLVSYEDGENSYWKAFGIKPFCIGCRKHFSVIAQVSASFV